MSQTFFQPQDNLRQGNAVNTALEADCMTCYTRTVSGESFIGVGGEYWGREEGGAATSLLLLRLVSRPQAA